MTIATDEFENYKPGDRITITEGPFEHYDAIVEVIKPGDGLLRVVINIFGREASIQLEPRQIRLAE